MSKKVKFLFPIIFILVFFFVVGYRYKEYVLDKNFILEVNTLCDQNSGNCFTSSSSDLNFGQNPYKKIKILASYAPKCLEEHSCESFICPANKNSECEITYCSNDTKTDGEECLYQNNKS